MPPQIVSWAIPSGAFIIAMATLVLGWYTLKQKVDEGQFRNTMETVRLRLQVLEQECARLLARIRDLEHQLGVSEHERERLRTENLQLMQRLFRRGAGPPREDSC